MNKKASILRKTVIVLLMLGIVLIVTYCIVYQNKKYIPVSEIYIDCPHMKGNELLWADEYFDSTIRIEAAGFDTIYDKCEIKMRGNSTLEADKLSYAFRFKDNKDVLGMGIGKKWVLLANAFDPTLMRNYIALYVASRLRLGYTSECRYVDLWINDTYRGNYLMTEPVQDGEDRVDIHPSAGDFLVEYEKSRDEEYETSYIVTNDGYRYLIHDPKHASEKQAEYVLDEMNHVEEIISEVRTDSEKRLDMSATSEMTENGSTESTANVIDKLSTVIDVDSFVDYCVFSELVKSVDMGFSSEYYYYKDGLLYAGPVWDYDLSSGNANASYYIHYSNLATTGDSTQGYWIGEQGKLLKELMDCPEFENMVWDRYNEKEVQDIITGIYSQGGLIDGLLEAYGESFAANYEEAGWDEGTQYFAYAGTPLPTFEENVEYLKDWYRRRNEWLIEYSADD